ncbi:MAG TPA: cation:proton antiporter [Candidatus Bathyarchaeia archaeon]|nr:cation:proton antiporter [Candidatus Bathyarchaeia archaeon]
MPRGTDTLLLQLFTIFVCAKICGEVFERLSLPAVLGEILAGIALGPYAANIIVPSDSIISLAEIGAIFLLFTVGLETSPHELIRIGGRSLNVAIAGIVLPFVCGLLYLKLHNESTHEAVFVAAAMVATSVGITARILQDMQVLKSRAAQIILGAAVFDDILGMVLLAIVVSVSSGTGVHWLHLGVVIAEAVGFAVFMVYFGPGVVRRMQPGLERLSTLDAPLMLALATCLLLSVAATKIGMAAIIGAFFAGLIFSDYSPEWGLRPRVYGIKEFLAPFFFFTMGARLDIRVFRGNVFVVAVIVSLLALVSKVVGCGLPMLKEGWRDAMKVGVGMTPRGEVALIIALIGLQMNMVSQRAYAIVIFMTGVTTLVPPPLLRYLFRDEIPADPVLIEPEEEHVQMG